jgi:membrane protein involved in colicin uptake
MNDKTPEWAAPPSADQAPVEQTSAPVTPVDEAALAEKAAQKAAAKAAKEQEAAAKKAEREAAKAAKAEAANEAKEAKEAAKAAKNQERAEKKAAKDAAIQARNEAKAAKLAEREQSKQPEQNGVRRPKPEGECGKAWALFDRLSQEKGAPVAAAEIRAELQKGSDLNEGNVRAEYPRWKKFHGLTGTIPPAAPLAPAAQPQPAA